MAVTKVIKMLLFFIPASNEENSHACMDISRMPQGLNIPSLGAGLLKIIYIMPCSLLWDI